MKLPNAERAIIAPRKIREYLLSPEHPVGRFKGAFFVRLGFTAQSWQELRTELEKVALQGDAEIGERTEYGQKYIVRGTIHGAGGRQSQILTVWIVLHGEEIPRFVTAYPEH